MGEALVEVRDLCKDYFEVEAVKNVSLSIQKGDVFGLIGPNGAGKTTLLKILATALQPTSGTADISRFSILTHEVEIRQRIGFMPDFFMLYEELKVWEVLDFFARAHKFPEEEIGARIDDVLSVVKLNEKKDSLVKGLSRGMMQRLGFARAILHKPELLLLDEPTSGLDPKGRVELLETLTSLHQSGATIMISSHILSDLAGFCTTFGIMEKGRLKIVTSDELTKDSGVRQDIILEVLKDAEHAVQILKQNSRVRDMRAENTVIYFTFSGQKKDLADLNAELVKNNVSVVSLYAKQKQVQQILQRMAEGETS